MKATSQATASPLFAEEDSGTPLLAPGVAFSFPRVHNFSRATPNISDSESYSSVMAQNLFLSCMSAEYNKAAVVIMFRANLRLAPKMLCLRSLTFVSLTGKTHVIPCAKKT